MRILGLITFGGVNSSVLKKLSPWIITLTWLPEVAKTTMSHFRMLAYASSPLSVAISVEYAGVTAVPALQQHSLSSYLC